ncbi:HesA/MoeB/ThiF family protein [Mucilaginibacter sp. SP1R1]|uniref:HesA/MoeB/ThiF family protein n=1 Tax=Mucilaginibacter sp. SP1R1 TaxID=2723091 RepID=UPI0018031C80|nr:ThiF family adenylyltransferase [Mucilaginibacter sp. SP1R1]MBB6149589.1 molybdopterin/thiamine biosynthesis adenylyltransferase [Mucilaginibacter sp. SP1R1]
MKTPKLHVKISSALYERMLSDLKRPHEFASERAGFIYTTHKTINGDIYVWINSYHPLNEAHYIDDPSVGVRFSGAAIRDAMEHVLRGQFGSLYVHLHDHKGMPLPSSTDIKSIPGVVQSLVNATPKETHGFLILSKNAFYLKMRVPGSKNFIETSSISVVGKPMLFQYAQRKGKIINDRYSRQSFLGPDSEYLFSKVRVGVVGLGGGGSHVSQQLAHIGILNPLIFDGDRVELSNLNRLIGAWFTDVVRKTSKTRVARRLIKKLLPKANVLCFDGRWQDYAEALQTCDIIIGCVDDFASRAELEAECRRYLIPYIDIGMDVHRAHQHTAMSGQIITSVPGMPCMRCMQYITEEKLATEAAKYGDVGIRPQVVWPNGVLASTAVGMVMELITGWTMQAAENIYLAYDGNKGTVTTHHRLNYLKVNCCPHYPDDQTGRPGYKTL